MSKITLPLALLKSRLSSRTWWADALRRALNTAVVIALPYLGGSLLTEVPWITLASAAGIGALASIATSLAGLPETVGVDLPWWLAAVERCVKSFAQAIAAGVSTAVLITEVDWQFILNAAIFAAVGSLLRLILATLPADPTVERKATRAELYGFSTGANRLANTPPGPTE